nr:Hsp70 family protein [bacterium]
ILEATAKDLTTNNEVSITVMATDNRLTEEEVKQLTRDAQERVARMMRHRKEEELANQVDSLLFKARRIFTDQEDPMAEEALRVVNELEMARNRADEDSVQEKIGQLTEMLTKYETTDY